MTTWATRGMTLALTLGGLAGCQSEPPRPLSTAATPPSEPASSAGRSDGRPLITVDTSPG